MSSVEKSPTEILKSTLRQQPVARVELPSLGRFYGDQVPDGVIEVMPMTARDIKLIGGGNLVSAVDTILRRCLVKFDPDQLLVTDRFYLYLALYANSYGDDYAFNLSCPNCETVAEYNVKIPTDLTVKNPKPEDQEPFSVKLPKSGIEMTFRLPRGKDRRSIERMVKDEKAHGFKDDGGDAAYFYSLATGILTINGNTTDYLSVLEIIKLLPAKDALYLEQTIEAKQPGVDLTVTKECKKCEFEIRALLPVTMVDLFRPFVIEKKAADEKAVPTSGKDSD